MNTSCSMPRSRADGVRIVFGPMKIFSLRVMARRTSFSLTNGEISTAGVTRGCDFKATLGGVDGSAADSLVAAPERSVGAELVAASSFVFVLTPNNRPATSLAIEDGLGNSFTADAALPDAALGSPKLSLPRAIP